MITDTHFDLKLGSQDILDVQMRAVNEMFDYMLANDIRHIFHLGDFTDNRKHISLNTIHHLQTQLFDKFVEHDFKMEYLVGNHDLHYKSTTEVNSMSIFAKAYSDHFVVHDKPATIDYDGVKFQFVPWIIDDVSIDDDADIILCHAELKDFYVMKGHKATHGLSKDLFKGKTVYSGHYHITQSEGKIKYLGNSFIQTSWSDFKDKKGFWVFDTEDSSIQFVESKSTPKHVKCHLDTEKKEVLIEGLYDVDTTYKLDSKFDYNMLKGHKLKVYATKELAAVKKFIETIDPIAYSWKLEIMDSEIEVLDIEERIEKAKSYSIDEKIVSVCDETDRDLVVEIIAEAKGLMKEAS